MRQSEARKTVIVLLTLIGIAAVLLILFGDMTPPARQNAARMHNLKEMILSYAAEYDKLPENIDDLRNSEVVREDTYGSPFRMTIEGNLVTLISYGADNKQGGIGFRRDMTKKFLARQPDGSWSPPEVDWE